MSGNFEMPKYGKLCSVRHQAKKTNDLLNAITAKFGCRIYWNKDVYAFSLRGRIERKTGEPIYFQKRGNKYADYLDLSCSDIEILRQVKAAFSDDFTADVQIKEGFC